MYHSITIGDSISSFTEQGVSHSRITGKNTWDDWHLIPSTRPLVNPPKLNTKGIQVPGRNGTLDMSRVLTGYMTYQNRTGSWEFIVDNDHWGWAVAYSAIMADIHGQEKLCVFEDDAGYYYKGLLSVNAWKSDKSWSLITIDYDLEPFKRAIQSSEEEWLWDPFNFETGIIRTNSKTLAGGESIEWVIPASQEILKPTIYVSSSNVKAYYLISTARNLTAGSHQYDWFKTMNVDSLINFTNTGSSSATVRISYREGVF